MPNHFFHFKQFTVQQQHCAMKVTTDGCLFGAWAVTVAPQLSVTSSILDIGTGTGLLSLMLAQKTSAKIDAVEIDAAAAMQAQQNFEASAWKEKLTVHHNAIQGFAPWYQYDFVITNPPFYDNDLKSADNKRNIALHGAGLSLAGLLAAINRLLKPTGTFALLLPFHRAVFFENLALSSGFYLHEKLLVAQTEKHAHFRAMSLFGREEKTVRHQGIIIKENSQYTKGFTALLKDYYLYQ